MALLQPVNWHNLDPIKTYVDQGSGIEDLFSNILKGYKAIKEPGKMKREEEKELLHNKIMGAEAEHAPEYFKERSRRGRLENEDQLLSNMLNKKYKEEEKKAEIAYKKAQTKSQESIAQSGGRYAPTIIEKARREREIAAAQYGENSKQVKDIDAYIEKITNQGMTGAVRTQQQKGDIASIELEQLEKFPMPERYLGALSDATLLNDALMYKAENDPKKKHQYKEDLSEMVAVWKQTMETAGIQLRALGIPATVHAIEQQAASINAGFPRFSKRAINNLPADVLKEGNRKFNERLKVLNKARSSYKPGKATEEEKDQHMADALQEQDGEMVTIEDDSTGERRTVTKAEARKLGAL